MRNEKFKLLSVMCLRAIITLFFAVSSAAMYGQTLEVKGKVTSGADKQSIPGASVSIKGSRTGVSTDSDGKFAINAKMGDVLQIISIGYASKDVKVSGSLIDVVLNEEATALDEVVVTALGMTREKKALGYSMTELSGDALGKVSSPNPIVGIQGKVAGVQIDMGNSGPQSSQRILIRGNTSLSGSNQPIFVVDGIIIENEVTKTDNGRDFGNELKSLNADDFETVSVLKGAAATALYGSRAANGVILITTKKGKIGEGVGVSFSHNQTWDNLYKVPDFQNEFGMGNVPVWIPDKSGAISRKINPDRDFGPRFDGKPIEVGGVYEQPFQADDNNLKDMFRTGRFINTNVAIHGGDEKGAFRFSYSNLTSNGLTFNNKFNRNNFSMNAQRSISKYLKADAGFTYTQSHTLNPTWQGSDGAPIYDFMYSVPREYQTNYWKQRYKSIKGDGWNEMDPYQYSNTLFDIFENNYLQDESHYRSYLNLTYQINDWLSFVAKGDINNNYRTRESKVLATGKSNYDGGRYEIEDYQTRKYKITGMLSAFKKFNDFGVSGSLAVEQDDGRGGYHKTRSVNGLITPGLFDMTNSKSQPTSEVRYNTDRKRINSVYGFVNMDYKGQIFLDITGRNDWSSSLVYLDGSGTSSYFYPSVGSSWLFTETFKTSMPKFISFGKIRASYAIVGSDTKPYVTTGTGVYNFDNTFVNPYTGASLPYYKFDSNALKNMHLKPEKQHSVEIGAEMKFFDNRLSFDAAWYKTNTKNQIIQLPMPRETGVQSRWINAGNIQNSGFELLVSGVPVKTKDWNWAVSGNITINRNKIIDLAPGINTYRLKGGGSDVESYATVGGAYGDIYTNYAFKYNDKGQKILKPDGAWQRADFATKVGQLEPKFMWGFTTDLSYKNFTLSVLVNARYGGDIFSGSYNYGRDQGVLKSSLNGRTQEYGGLERTITFKDGRPDIKVHDGMIPDGVFADGSTISVGAKQVDVSGKTYEEVYKEGLIGPLSAYTYYTNLHSWGSGIRESAMMECSWIALREVSLNWSIPKKWTQRFLIQKATVGLIMRDLGYLYNSLPDGIHPEGLNTIYSSEFYERGGSPYSRKIGFSVNLNF